DALDGSRPLSLVNARLTLGRESISCSHGHRDHRRRHLAPHADGRIRPPARGGRVTPAGRRGPGPDHAARSDPGPAAKARPQGPSPTAGDPSLRARPGLRGAAADHGSEPEPPAAEGPRGTARRPAGHHPRARPEALEVAVPAAAAQRNARRGLAPAGRFDRGEGVGPVVLRPAAGRARGTGEEPGGGGARGGPDRLGQLLGAGPGGEGDQEEAERPPAADARRNPRSSDGVMRRGEDRTRSVSSSRKWRNRSSSSRIAALITCAAAPSAPGSSTSASWRAKSGGSGSTPGSVGMRP